jgi:hypothetical protein
MLVAVSCAIGASTLLPAASYAGSSYFLQATTNRCTVTTADSVSTNANGTRNALHNSNVKCDAPLNVASIQSDLSYPGGDDLAPAGQCVFSSNPSCGVTLLGSGDQALSIPAGTYTHETDVVLEVRELPDPPPQQEDPWIAWDPRMLCTVYGTPPVGISCRIIEPVQGQL